MKNNIDKCNLNLLDFWCVATQRRDVTIVQLCTFLLLFCVKVRKFLNFGVEFHLEPKDANSFYGVLFIFSGTGSLRLKNYHSSFDISHYLLIYNKQFLKMSPVCCFIHVTHRYYPYSFYTVLSCTISKKIFT